MRINNRAVQTVFLLVLMMFGFSVAADKVYTWKDEKGVVHFGDQPQYEDTQEVNVDVNYQVDQEAVNRHTRARKEMQVEEKDHKQEQADAAMKKKKSAETYQKCKKAQDMHASYSKAQFLYKKDENGKRQVLPAEEKAKAMADVKNYIDKWCQ